MYTCNMYCFIFQLAFALEYVCRYEEVIQACDLDVDISVMDRGDMSQIGEKGTNLSGGQKARLALARSVLSIL
jgi:ABC-type bacteriocin/lantibiotic exporter with double-glycine peptidase domain